VAKVGKGGRRKASCTRGRKVDNRAGSVQRETGNGVKPDLLFHPDRKVDRIEVIAGQVYSDELPAGGLLLRARKQTIQTGNMRIRRSYILPGGDACPRYRPVCPPAGPAVSHRHTRPNDHEKWNSTPDACNIVPVEVPGTAGRAPARENDCTQVRPAPSPRNPKEDSDDD
jgi:hypothetical protein